MNEHFDWPYEEPALILDDVGVRHQNALKTKNHYELFPCECGIIHEEKDNTWWHSTITLSLLPKHRIGIYRFCKTCLKPLMMKKIKD